MPDEPVHAALRIPLWIKVAWTVLLCVIVPIYWKYYGPRNFLWFSDIALFLVAGTLWLESRWLASLAALSALPLEIAWNVEFVVRVVGGIKLLGLVDYMYDTQWPLAVRLLTLWHLPLVVLIVYLVWKFGYEKRALIVQTAIAWIIFPISYLAADWDNNINWVLGFGARGQHWMQPWAYVIFLMILVPTAIYLPTHWVLKWLFSKRNRRTSL